VAGAVDLEAAARSYLDASAAGAAAVAGGDLPSLVARAGSILGDALRAGGTVLFCGNGGSAADAQHLAAELVGRLDARRDRRPLAAVALTTDSSVLTSLANDFGYEEVFARQVDGLGRPADVLVCISTSGRSENVLRAARAAKERGLAVVALAGPDPSDLDDAADVTLHLPGATSGQIQQGHIIVGHAMCLVAEAAASA
jgi:D-sedoheptulose 7-phosphate isomerase